MATDPDDMRMMNRVNSAAAARAKEEVKAATQPSANPYSYGNWRVAEEKSMGQYEDTSLKNTTIEAPPKKDDEIPKRYVAPTPPTPPPVIAPPVNNSVTQSIKTATPDIIIFDDETVPIEIMTDLVFEDIGGQELINIGRNDLINGQSVIYQPIKNLGLIQQQYNPNNIISVQDTSDKYFAGFSIKFDSKIPTVGNGPNGENVYLDQNTGDIVIELINVLGDEQVEVQTITSGTIYKIDFEGPIS
jgi:hypothetical protein